MKYMIFYILRMSFLEVVEEYEKQISPVYSLGGVNIHAQNNSVFYWAYKHKHTQLIKWLESLE